MREELLLKCMGVCGKRCGGIFMDNFGCKVLYNEGQKMRDI